MQSNQIWALIELAEKYLTNYGFDQFKKEWEGRDLTGGTYESYKRIRNGICYNNFQAAIRELTRYPIKTEVL